MGELSIWHWLIVFGVAALLMVFRFRGRSRAKQNVTSTSLRYSVTQYLCASVHEGYLSSAQVIERLTDRHRARLPEIGLDTDSILREARLARQRDMWFGLAYVPLSIWLLLVVMDYGRVADETLTVSEFAWEFVPVLAALAGVGFVKSLMVTAYLRKRFLSPEPSKISLAADNVNIFGGFSPFAGFGFDLDGWSFTIDTTKPKEGRASSPEHFSQVELLDAVSERVRGNLNESEIADRLFVSGKCIRESGMFLDGIKATPKTCVAPEIVAAQIGRHDSDARHYRIICVPLAGGHLALTMFLRSTMLGRNIFIESRSFLLTSIRPAFTTLNALSTRSGGRYYLRLASASLVMSLVAWTKGATTVVELLGRCRPFFEEAFGHPEDKLKETDAGYNYGHDTSFRESLASGSYQTYFQMLDKDRTSKTCQYIVLNAIVDFLENKGIATDDIKERRTQIFNSGVIVSGGTVNAQQMAIGSGATVKAKIATAVSGNASAVTG